MLKKLKAALERNLKTQQLSNQSGFTLVEMLIVITLIGVVATLLATNLNRRFTEAKQGATKIQIRQVGLALEDFKRVCGRYPTTDQGLEALISQTNAPDCKNYDPEGYWKEKRLPKDGWDKDFIYTSDGSRYVIKSLGDDGKEGGTGLDRDLSNEDTE